jgi:DNA repair protein RadD
VPALRLPAGVRKPDLVIVTDGELALVQNGRASKAEANPYVWHSMLVAISQENNYKPGWAAHKFKEKFGRWPTVRPSAPMEPSAEVRSWVRSRTIAWLKSKERRAS